MTREEEIKQAAKANSSQMCNLCLDKYCLEMGLTCPNLHESVIAFTYGAKWADKNPVNVWHDASEEPQDKNKRILSYSEYFDCFFLDFPNYLMIKDGGQNKNWETVVLRYKMSKWAYVSDLFPKGGAE